MKDSTRLNKTQQKLVLKFKNYLEHIVWQWIKEKGYTEYSNDLLSEAYQFLIQCALKYKKDNPKKASFKTFLVSCVPYLYIYLQRWINWYLMITINKNKYILRRYIMPECFFNNIQVEEIYYNLENFENILSKSKLIKEIEKNILREIFINEKTMTQIGNNYNISKQRVHQLYKSGLNKLKKVYQIT